MKHKILLIVFTCILILFSHSLSVCASSNDAEPENCGTILTFDSQETINEWAKSSFNSEIKNGISGIIITGEIMYVPSFAFCDMVNLRTVDMSHSAVNEIQDSAFWGCMHLETILFSNSTCAIREEAFYGTAICHLSLPAQIKVIEAGAFDYCLQLETVEFAGVPICFEGTFSDCYSLRQIAFPEGMADLGIQTCFGCEQLISVSIPSSVQKCVAFAEQSGLRRIIFMGTPECFAHSVKLEYYYPRLKQLVFLSEPPNFMAESELIELEIEPGLLLTGEETIFYLNKHRNSWSPNGETEWNGIPIIGIDSLDDLPPVE